MKIFRTVLLSLAIFASTGTAVFAECDRTRCVGKILKIYVNSNQVLVTTNGHEGRLDCQLVSNAYLTLEYTHPAFDQLYALLLAAKSAGMTTTLRIRTGSDGCVISYAVVD